MIAAFVDGQDQSSFVSASAGTAMMPAFTASCPQGNHVDSDGSTVRVNGQVARVTPFNHNYVEARTGNVIHATPRPREAGTCKWPTHDPPGSRGGYCQILSSGGDGAKCLRLRGCRGRPPPPRPVLRRTTRGTDRADWALAYVAWSAL
jgi:hypothetical protein